MSAKGLVDIAEIYRKKYPPARIEAMAAQVNPFFETLNPNPMSKRRLLWIKFKNLTWWRPWAFIHRVLPGDCECDL